MVDTTYHRPEYISLEDDTVINETWVQDIIGNDPRVLGLGDLILQDKERRQKRAGRLDLLLQDEDNRRYEVEVQLGATDESHIIRTIEYWDIERKLYPQYDHCAVLVAEDVTSRFLNVISLFNGSIPLVAIQMRALRVDGKLTLVFTKVVEELARGLVDEDEDIQLPASREDWLRSYPDKVPLADEILSLAKQFEPALSLKYNKQYLTFTRNGARANFIWLTPRKRTLDIGMHGNLGESSKKLEEAGLEVQFNQKYQETRVSVTAQDLQQHSEILRGMLKDAYQRYLKE
jgi:hypothetical protein